MKRRGFLKGLAAALAVAPVVASQPAEVTDDDAVDRAEVARELRADFETAAERWDRDEASRVALIERFRADPAVQDFLMRRVLERLHQQYPPYVLVPPTLTVASGTNVKALDWRLGQQYTYPGTIDPIPLPRPSAPWPFSRVDDG